MVERSEDREQARRQLGEDAQRTDLVRHLSGQGEDPRAHHGPDTDKNRQEEVDVALEADQLYAAPSCFGGVNSMGDRTPGPILLRPGRRTKHSPPPSCASPGSGNLDMMASRACGNEDIRGLAAVVSRVRNKGKLQ